MSISVITRRYAIILGMVALLCAGFSTAVYLLTKTKIDEEIALQQRTLLKQIIAEDKFDNDVLASCKRINLPQFPFLNRIYFAKKDENLTAYAIQATAPDGYSGNITMIMGIQPDGTVLGVRTLAHQETPGLGDKIEIRISDWIYSFNNQRYSLATDANWAVKKDGGQFDQFTGATITPRAVVNVVRQSAKWVVTNLAQSPQLIDTFSSCE